MRVVRVLRVSLALPVAALVAGTLAGYASGASGPRFPDRIPAHTELAYADTYIVPTQIGSRQIISREHEMLALTHNRTVYFHCLNSTALHQVEVSGHLVGRWIQLLTNANLPSLRSDNPQARPIESPELWFKLHGDVVYLQAGRHEHPGPCSGTACTPVLESDATLRAVTPSREVFQNFLGTHCRSR